MRQQGILILIRPKKKKKKKKKNNVEKVDEVDKHDGRITLEAYAHLQTIKETATKLQKVWYKTEREVAATSNPCHCVTIKKNN